MKVTLTFEDGRARITALAESETERRMLMVLSEKRIEAVVEHDAHHHNTAPTKVSINITEAPAAAL